MFASGDVTTYVSVAGFRAIDLEQRIGFRHGRLAQGYAVYELEQMVRVGEFIWGDHTRFSGAWQSLRELDRGEVFERDLDEYAQRIDLVRAELGKRLHYNERAVDAELALFQRQEAAKLNVRTGPNRIVKLRPVVPDDRSIARHIQYPNALLRGVPQWKILKRHPKLFRKLADVPAGGIFR